MREIKFRAHINPKTIIYFTLEDLVNPNPLFSIRELLIPWLRSGHKPDDYTGLKDKNGKGIYEGDIVSQGDNYPSVIEWCQFGEMIEGTGWCLHEYYPQKVDIFDCYHTTDSYTDGLEVIGNIYENPELLREGK